jgi:hypothetical protein
MRHALQLLMKFNLPRQRSMVLDSLELRGMSAAERSAVISHLARLLMQAAAPAAGVCAADRGWIRSDCWSGGDSHDTAGPRARQSSKGRSRPPAWRGFVSATA